MKRGEVKKKKTIQQKRKERKPHDQNKPSGVKGKVANKEEKKGVKMYYQLELKHLIEQ